MELNYQAWDDKAYCENYALMWGISTDEVHYGWLAPGEKDLRLLDGINFHNANVLDIGCGMGENLVALSKKGATCYGIDISKHMLEYANVKISKDSGSGTISLKQDDMRGFNSFLGVTFDLVLSIYSLEYLTNLSELRAVLLDVYYRLKPGGVFIFCFSHPLQHTKHEHLHNRSAHSDLTNSSNLIYSFRDVVNILSDIDFTVERIIEQKTRNPSMITFEQAKKYPYRFTLERNPCKPEFDALSNASPHTVIYKVIKPKKTTKQPLLFNGKSDTLQIWFQNRKITKTISFEINVNKYSIKRLAPKDSVVGVCEVLNFIVSEKDVSLEQLKDLSLRVNGQNKLLGIRDNCLLNVVCHKLRERGLKYELKASTVSVSGVLDESVFINKIKPISGHLDIFFPSSTSKKGVLVFVNGKEPAGGTVGLQSITPALGDNIQVIYIITHWGSSWRKKGIDANDVTLFSDAITGYIPMDMEQGFLFET